MREAFKKEGFGIIKEGEIETLIPDEHLAEITGKSLKEIEKAKEEYPNKVSKAFQKILFNKSKAEYAFDLVEYYSSEDKTPFDGMIKWFVKK